MLPSYGLFAEISCPFLKRGLCERSHCLFKHDKEGRDMFETSYKPPVVECLGIQHYEPSDSGAQVNAEAKGDCLQELERINKEIETVKNEVEQEQRRLSLYRTEQVDCGNAVWKRPQPDSDTTSRNVNGVCYTPNASKKPTRSARHASQASKYVVDNSKPRTDLEYDPLSNFSAGLRSCSSSGRDLKARSGPGVKRVGETVLDEPEAHLDQEPSPGALDADEGVLVIDVPSSPERKRSRAEKPSIKPRNMVETSVESQPSPVSPVRSQKRLLNSQFVRCEPPPVVLSATDDVNACCSETTAECGNNFDIFDNLSRCLEDLRSENDRMASSGDVDSVEENTLVIDLESPPRTSEPFWESRDIQVVKDAHFCSTVKLPQSELAYCIEGMDPMQPKCVQEATFSLNNTPMASSLPSSHQFTHQNEPPAQCMVPNYWSAMQSVPSYPLSCQKKTEFPPACNISPSSYLDQLSTSEPSTSVQSYPRSGVEPLLMDKPSEVEAENKEVILIDSSSEEVELHSDMELSDSDPMEECYRIFMEANQEKNGATEQPTIPVAKSNVERPELNVKSQALPAVPGQKRVAHVAKHAEPVAKARPPPQVLVPLRGPSAPAPAAQLCVPSKIHQIQQKASTLTAAVKGAQAYISSTSQSKPESMAAPPYQDPASQPASIPGAYVNCLPVGTTVIQVGNNLHFILPESSYPLPITSIATPVSSVLTPITPMHVSPGTPLQVHMPTTVTPVPRYRPAAPTAMTHAAGFASSVNASALQGPVHVPAKPLPTKRKFKQRPEGVKDKVPHDVRQRYVNMFTEEFLKTSATVNEAFEKALAEETAVYNRSINKLKYLSVAVNALKRLKNQGAVTAKDENENGMTRSRGLIQLDLKNLKQNDDAALYDSLKEYFLNEEKLIENNYPLQHPEKPGSAVLFADNKKSTTDPLKRICCRCGATYSVSQTGKHTRKEECNYHYGKGVKHRVPGGVETRYSCCEGVMGTPGCQVFKLHVHDTVSLDGFVSTRPRAGSDASCPGVFAVDCEMCYATDGLELCRVTVVNSSLQVVYDTFVRSSNEVIDYNTRFSGICEEDVKDISTSIREVQETLLSFISAETVVIGHGLETNLCALKLLHSTVVDTSVVFPHRLGPPHKLTLNNLTAEYLRRIIQDSVCGHDTADDATACMELMLWKVKEDGKGRRW